MDQLRNSLITAGGGALLTVVLATYAAYSFAKFRYRARKPLMFLMLSAQMFPFAMMLISLYPLLQWAGLLNTRIGLIVAYIILALPSGTYMLYSYFVNIPTEIIEAARADGAGEWYILHRIVLPLAMPALITVGLYSFMWAWDELLFPLPLLTRAPRRLTSDPAAARITAGVSGSAPTPRIPPAAAAPDPQRVAAGSDVVGDPLGALDGRKLRHQRLHSGKADGGLHRDIMPDDIIGHHGEGGRRIAAVPCGDEGLDDLLRAHCGSPWFRDVHSSALAITLRTTGLA